MTDRLKAAQERLAAAMADLSAKKAEYERAELLARAARDAMNQASQHVQDERAAVKHEQFVIDVTNWAKADVNGARRLLSAKLSELDAGDILPLKDLGIVEIGRGALRYNTSRRASARRIMDGLEEGEP